MNSGIQPGGWQGIAIGDVNNDGLEDVYVCQNNGLPNRLLIQQPDGTVRDVSAAAGVDILDLSRSALLIDLDNDGDQDLALLTAGELIVFSNEGQLRFKQRVKQSVPATAFSMAAADYDADADLDIYVCGRIPISQFTNEKFLGFPVPYHDANNGGANSLWRNDPPDADGNWRLTNVTAGTGLDVNNRRYAYAASWEDFDNDGDLDLYIANDFGRNSLFRNDGGRFRDIAPQAQVEDVAAGMSITWGDYNNDGLMDAYVSNMFSSAGNRVAYQRDFRSERNKEDLAHYRHHARGNTLFQNAGDERFYDVTLKAGVSMGRWAWCAKFFDLNNDGWEDLLVTNGFISSSKPDDL